MKIIIDCRFVRHSGLGRYIREVVMRLVSMGEHEYVLLVSRLENDERFMEYCAGYNRVSFIYCNANMYSIKEQLMLPWKIPAGDIFWAPHYNAPILPIRARKKIVTIHDMGHLAIEKFSLIKSLYARLFMYTSAHYYDRIITDSIFSQKEICKYEKIQSEKITVAYCAVDISRFRVNKELCSKNMLENKYGFSGNYFLYVGNIKPHKNIIAMLKSFALWKQQTEREEKLLIVGKKEGFLTGVKGLDEILQGIAMPKEIIFTGYVDDDDLPYLYAHATALVFPSLYEGFGLPPLEAMAAGCPVVTSTAASLPEVCAEAAIYVNPYQEEEIARGLSEVSGLEDANRQKLINAGYERVSVFSWDKTAELIKKTFEEMND